MQSRPVMLVFPFPLLAHYLRCLVLARQYAGAYTILFKDVPAYTHLIQAEGFGTFPCADYDPSRVMADTRAFTFGWLNEADSDHILNEQLHAIRLHQPTLVLGDMAPTLKIAAALTGVHFVSLINGYMSCYYALHRPIATSHPAYRFSYIIPGRVFRSLVSNQEHKAFVAIHRPLAALRSKYGLPPLTHYLEEFDGDETLLCDDPEVFPQHDAPATYRSVGPLLYQPAHSPVHVPSGGRKVIIATFGSSGEWEKARCLAGDAFAVYHIVTVGDDAGVLRAGHITALPFTPLHTLLPQAALLISHGGNGTLNFAYKYGVPFIAIPSIMDQEWNALRFAQVMPGRMLTGKITSRRMQRTIGRLLGASAVTQ